MRQSMLLSFCLMIAIVGCTRTGAAPTPTPPPPPTAPPIPTLPPPTATTVPTVESIDIAPANPTTNTSGVPDTASTADTTDAGAAAQLDVTPPTDCAIPADWTPYEIQSGDTLYSLGLQTETTIEDLANGNCLENPDVLDLGQVIYLPSSAGDDSAPDEQAPIGDGAGAGPPPVNDSLAVSVSPFREQGGNFVLAPGPVTLIINNVYDPNTARVTFFVAPRGTAANPTPIATVEPVTTSTLSVTYDVQPNLIGDLYAVAYDAAGQELGRSPSIPVVADVG